MIYEYLVEVVSPSLGDSGPVYKPLVYSLLHHISGLLFSIIFLFFLPAYSTILNFSATMFLFALLHNAAFSPLNLL